MSDPRHIPGCFGAYGQECVCVAPQQAAVIPPDAARDARVARRRAEDARRSGVALDKLLGIGREVYVEGFNAGYADGYEASQLHHNRHYDVPADACRCAGVGYGGKGDCRYHGVTE
jgi:hypothetical protein